MRSVAVCVVLLASFGAPLGYGGVIDAAGISPSSTPVGVGATVVVAAQISDPAVIPTSVNLLQLDTQNRVLGVVGYLNDSGANGDLIAGDRTFTIAFSVYQETPGPLRYRVTAAFLGTLRRANSSPLDFNVTGAFATGVTISQPANLAFVNTSPITVSGTSGDPDAGVAVNGIQAAKNGNAYQASVPLQEGNNTITAVAANSNGTSSAASIQVTLDTTPPRVTVDSPAEGFETTEASISVTGIVNDIVVGTVNSQQAQVTVNGIAATVANRTYTASNVPLQLGMNTIQVIGRDQTGNSATTSVQVVREQITQPFIKLISGNNQSGVAGTQLPQPLVAQLLNGSAGVPNAPVVFKITENDGFLQPGAGQAQIVVVNTNGQGQAEAMLTLGNRAGAGNNTVEAFASGFQGSALFIASGNPKPAAKINVDSGNNQFGAVGKSLALPFVAVVTDEGHNRLAGVPVTFKVVQGGGKFGAATTSQTVTDGDGRALAVLTLGPQPGQDNNLVEATFPGGFSLSAAFTASGKVPGDPSQTSISGVVLDNSNIPIPGVTMRLFEFGQANNNNQHVEVVPPVQTDAQGLFRIQPAPVGAYKLMADGQTADVLGKHYPTLEYDVVTVAGQDNNVGMPIYLPALDPLSMACVDEDTGGVVQIASAPGFSLTILPGSATFPGGSKTGCVSVTAVNPDKVPMVPGFGQQPRYVVTIQPVGTIFNPPAAITIPNMDGLTPNAKTEMYSFDHDLAAFVAIGSATVSVDGSIIASDPGVGVIKAGWHCGGNPNTSGSAATCPTCQKCEGNQCAADNGQTPPQTSPTDCKKEICSGGSAVSQNNDSEEPTEICKECKNGSPANRGDGSTPTDSTKCCFDGESIEKAGVPILAGDAAPSGSDIDARLEELMTKCPNKTQDTSKLHQIDGCSGGLTSNIQDPINGSYGTSSLAVALTAFGNPEPPVADGAPLQFDLPCNNHDICYQTCGANRGVCDDAMNTRMDNVCTNAYPSTCPSAYSLLQCASFFIQRTDCFLYSDLYHTGLQVGGGSAHQQRQSQFCQCCQ